MSDDVIDWLRVLIILVSLILACFTFFKKFDIKWPAGTAVSLLVIALLACSIDRLEFIKTVGLEAQLSKMEKATKEAYATIEEVEKSRQEMRSLGETLALQHAQTIMTANRLLGENFIFERAKSIQILFDTLKKIDASPETTKKVNDIAEPYIRFDLKNDIFRRVDEALTQSESEKAKALLRDRKFNREQFFEDFINGYEIGKTFQDVSSYLNEFDVEVTDDVQQSFKRLDTFLRDGVLLDSRGNKILTLPNPQG